MTTDKQIEELLKPRYKVIADYPKSEFEIGEIIQFDRIGFLPMIFLEDQTEGWLTDFIEKPRGSVMYSIKMFEPYPHLFQPLQWWEERPIEELPLYVRFGEKGKQYAIYKIIEWNPEHAMEDFKPWGYAERPKDYFISLRFPNNFPATREEYDNYQHSKPQTI